jgi:predicted nucleic acid-binding protein
VISRRVVNASPLIFLTGESSVIAVALQHSGSMAILDDLAARRCAQALKLPMQGTLGLVLVAKRIGLIKAVLPVVEDLEHAGMYMTARLKTQILDAAGE